MSARGPCLENTVFPWNPYFCRKLSFPEHPVTVTTFWADGSIDKVSEESVKRDLARRLLDKLSLKDLNELNAAVTALPRVGRRYDPSSGELVTGEVAPSTVPETE